MDYDYLNVSDGNGNAALMHVQTERISGATTLDVDIVTGVPEKFIGTYGNLLASGFIDPATARDFYGHLDGSNLEIDSFAPGNADDGTPEGYVVIIKPSTPWANLVAQGVQGTALFPDNFSDFVEQGGGVWTQSSGLNGDMSAGHIWYQGHRNVINAVSGHLFTASKDTYVDFDPTTGDPTYVEATNGDPEPAVTSGNVRVAKVVTDASGITDIEQGWYNAPVANAAVRDKSIEAEKLVTISEVFQTAPGDLSKATRSWATVATLVITPTITGKLIVDASHFFGFDTSARTSQMRIKVDGTVISGSTPTQNQAPASLFSYARIVGSQAEVVAGQSYTITVEANHTSCYVQAQSLVATVTRSA